MKKTLTLSMAILISLLIIRCSHPYIEFWHRLDTALITEVPGMGPELLGDDAWVALFSSGVPYENPDIEMEVWSTSQAVYIQDRDQIGTDRPQNILGDIGAVETP